MSGEMQTVTFQAAKTNSAPPPVSPHVAALETVAYSEKTQGFAHTALIAVNCAFVWIVAPNVPVGIAAFVLMAIITAFPAKAYVLIPYFRSRRPEWADFILSTVKAATLVAAITAVCAVYSVVQIGIQLASIPSRPIAEIQRDLDGAARYCQYDTRSCINRRFYSAELAAAKRKAENPTGELSAEDVAWYGVLAIMMLIAVAVAYSWILPVEASRAIQENGKALPPKLDDPDAKLKRRGLEDWLQSGSITLTSDTSKTELVEAVFKSYENSFKGQYIKPPMYGLAEFKAAFKDATGKEPEEVKGEPAYRGVTLASATLI